MTSTLHNRLFAAILLSCLAGLFGLGRGSTSAVAQELEEGTDSFGSTGTVPNEDESKERLKSKDFFLRKEDPSKYERLAREKRAEAITLLRGILDSGNVQGEQLAEMYMRLADLYWETAKDTYLQEMADYFKAYDAWMDTPVDQRGDTPEQDHSPSQSYNRQAIELYRTILREHRRYKRMDEVYFNLAFNLSDLGEKEQGLEYYQTLVKNYPQSDFVPDAYLAIGEYYFDNNNAFKALGNYRKAATYTDSQVHVFARYKLGWCYYNVGEYQKAIDTMKKVIAQSVDTGETQGKLLLREEALNDLVLFFSELGDMEAAYTYFSKFGEKKHYSAMLRRLAGTYLEQGKNEQAITTYERLISEDPLSPRTPSYQNEIIGAYFRAGKKRKTLQQIDVLAANYGPGSSWSLANADHPSAIKEANGMIERNLRKVAVDYHKEARKTKSKKTYGLAEESYEKYLAMFPENKYSYNIRFAYGEVLYELKKYPLAAAEYERVIKIDLKGKHFKDAASSLILTIDKIMGQDETKHISAVKRKPGVDGSIDITPRPLSDWEKRKVAACDTYSDTLVNEKDSPNILYEGARLLYDKNHFSEATPRFSKIIERYPKLQTAEIAANLILDSYNLQEEWARLNQTARAYHQQPDFNPKFKKELRRIFEQATYKQIERLEKDKKYKEAAESYTAFAKEFPKSDLTDRALFNAAVYFFKAKDIRQSIAMRQALRRDFPKSEFADRNLDALGKVFESIADYQTSAGYYEELAARDKKRTYEGTPDALYNAGLFRYSLGEWEKAIEDYKAYYREYGNRDDAHLLLLEVGRIYESHGLTKEALGSYRTLFSTPRWASRNATVMFEARLRYGKLLRELGKEREGLKHFKASHSLYERMLKRGRTFDAAPAPLAEMAFSLVDPLFTRFSSMKIELPKRGQKGSALDPKLKLMEQVAGEYNKVLQLKQGEWGIAALVRIGEAYQNLAETVLNAPIPTSLRTEQQKQLYRAALKDRAFPLQDQAADALEQALGRSYELGIYNNFTALAASRLAELRPKEYPALTERLDKPDRLSDTFFTADFIR